eukprot:c44502_g1_i1 orf=113-283(-)
MSLNEVDKFFLLLGMSFSLMLYHALFCLKACETIHWLVIVQNISGFISTRNWNLTY